MFDALNKALEAQEKEEEKIQKRKSKRLSKKLELESSNGETDGGLSISIPPDERSSGSAAELNQLRISLESDIEEDEDDLLEDRPKWENNYIFTFHMIAFAVGGSNVWRFGVLCYENGGICFMIPYTILTFVCAFPLMYLELIIGQYAQVGVIAAWKIAPIFKGVGVCMVLASFLAMINVHSILGWCLFYIFQASFHRPLPWISCDNGFGRKSNGLIDHTQQAWNEDEMEENESKNWHTENCTEFYADAGTDEKLTKYQRLPGTEFFRGRVQRMWKSAFEDKVYNYTKENGAIVFGFNTELGILDYNLDTGLILFIVFVIVALCTIKGIKLNTNIVVFMTIFPYVLLAVLFYRATGLSGAWAGLRELFKPDFSKIYMPTTWWKCAEQVFFSTGAGFGVHLTCASYNAFNRKIVYDAAIVIVINAVTSVISACTIFMFLGHVNVAVHKEIEDLVRSGPELVFEVMPDVLGVLAKPNFYSTCFYVFIFLVAFSTVTTAIICYRSAYLEMLPMAIKFKSVSRIKLVSVIYTINFMVSSLNLTRGGLHSFYFIETFVGLYTFPLMAFFFVVGVTWIFGLREIIDATKAMQIRAPGIYYQICWKYVCPFIFASVFAGHVFDASRLQVKFNEIILPLNMGLYAFGLTLAAGPFFTVIIGAIVAYWKAPGQNFKQKLLICISPTREHAAILETGTGKRAKPSHYLYLYAPTPGNKFNICCSLHRHSKVYPEEKFTYQNGELIPEGHGEIIEPRKNSGPEPKPVIAYSKPGEVQPNKLQMQTKGDVQLPSPPPRPSTSPLPPPPPPSKP